MNKKIAAGILFLLAGSMVLTTPLWAEKPKKLSQQEQLEQILASQKAMEQKIAAMEMKQTAIMNLLTLMRTGTAQPQRPAGGPSPEDFGKEYKIDAGHSSILGNKDAKITIVEFSDFQCPYSQRFHPVVNEILKAYPNDVKYILKNFPLGFHPEAKPAAKATFAAREQGKYWEMVETLFNSGRNLSAAQYIESAQKLGLNVDQFKKDLAEKDAQWEKLIAEDIAVANTAAVGGTPTFYMNGKKTMARDLAGFKTAIDEILKQPEKK